MPRLRLTLLTRFSLISLVVLAVVGAALAKVLTDNLEQQAIQQQVVGISAMVPPVIGPYINDDLLANGAHDKTYSAIETAFSYLGGSGLVRIRIWNKAGVIVFSDEPSLIGKSLPVSNEVNQALQGRRTGFRSSLSQSGDAYDRGYGQLLEVYIPLQMPGHS